MKIAESMRSGCLRAAAASLAYSAVLLAALAMAGCSRHTENLRIKGSETMLPIAFLLAEHFASQDSLPPLSVTAGGSGVGIAALRQGNASIAMSSRDIKASERLEFSARHLHLRELVVAYDALALVVHKTNPVDSLSLDQLKDIYQGKIENWKQVGGPDLHIVAFNRESSSGTYGFFQEMVLKKEDFGKLETVGANGELVEKVRANNQSLGYVGIAYVDTHQVKALRIYNTKLNRSVFPDIENSMNKTYPLVRPLYFYYLAQDSLALRPVVAYLTSPAGELLVRRSGYPPNPALYSPKTP